MVFCLVKTIFIIKLCLFLPDFSFLDVEDVSVRVHVVGLGVVLVVVQGHLVCLLVCYGLGSSLAGQAGV